MRKFQLKVNTFRSSTSSLEEADGCSTKFIFSSFVISNKKFSYRFSLQRPEEIPINIRTVLLFRFLYSVNIFRLQKSFNLPYSLVIIRIGTFSLVINFLVFRPHKRLFLAFCYFLFFYSCASQTYRMITLVSLPSSFNFTRYIQTVLMLVIYELSFLMIVKC